MDIETRNKYCGLLMFNTVTAKNSSSSEFILDSPYSVFEQPESYYYKSNNSESQETSIAAGAADVTNTNTSPSVNNNKDNSDNNNNINYSNSVNKSNNNNKSSTKSKTEKAPPRPPNAFILYRREKQPAILATHRNLSNAAISRYIAELWRNESNETRLKWERFADQTKLEHMKAYPNYVYRPNKNKEKSERKRNKQTASNNNNNNNNNKNNNTTPIAATTSAYVSNVNTIPDLYQGDSIGPIRVSTKGQHRVNMIDRPQPQLTTSFTDILYNPIMNISNISYTDIPSTTSSISPISSISPVTPFSQQMNHINSISPINDFQTYDDLLADFSFPSVTADTIPTTIPTTIPITIPTTIPTTTSPHSNTIVDPSIVYCNSSCNDDSYYNQQQFTTAATVATTIPLDYFGNYSFSC